MKPSSKYFDSIRINPGGKKKRAAEEAVSRCQWEGCEQPGRHKAPAGRNRDGEYLWFCLDHVRDYNKNYNYFSGLTDDEIARFQKDAMLGNRPTWKMGTANAKTTAAPTFAEMKSGSAKAMRMRDPAAWARAQNAEPVRRLKPLESKAMRTLGLKDTAGAEAIKTRYKELVKKHHPDANGGDRTSEERFRDVIQAYQLLKTAGLC
ncbi:MULTISPECIES: J domain-containing protein [unclassified Roseitalea]|uniref:J domain-containing protein n=1 Tax=unclassified Roseitalea TaxID=2639107 RepID=UPI00273EA7D7|nr:MULTISPECIES: J domain-containing protein [unclassified Roseitalea]